MAALIWDQVGERTYETGVDRGVLYIPTLGVYDKGVAWNGLTTVSEAPTGGEATPFYADNIKYLNLYSVEEFQCSIEAVTYPDEFDQFDGLVKPEVGVSVGQQTRKAFGLSYRTRIGTDTDPDAGYKIHLVYGCTASPSEKGYSSINDSPEPITFSWEIMTSPVAVTGLKPSASLTINSLEVDGVDLAALEDLLYGSDLVEPALPLPDDVISIFATAG